MSLLIKTFTGVLRSKPVCSLGRNGGDLRENISEVEGIPSSEIVLTCNGRLVADDDILRTNCVYHVALKLKGGKGGFGSMLRMLGAQIEKTTNHEACRDLSGRRMRDVNNEKKLAEWVKNKADAEAERERRRREKLERMARDPKHYFVDPNYDQQKQDVTESLQEAVSKGMEASASTSNGASTSGIASSSVKRKAGVNGSSSGTKKRCMWMGVEEDSDGDDDSDEDETHQGDYATPSNLSSSEVKDQGEDSSSSSSSSVADTEKNDGNIRKDSEQDIHADVSSSTSGDDTTQEAEQTTGPVDLEQYTSVTDLEALGLERLKTALMDRGLKCGGTLEQRAERLFSVKGLSPEQIDPALKTKSVKGKKKGKK